MKCPHCDREDFFSVSRQRSLVEFRMIKTTTSRKNEDTKKMFKESRKSGEFKFDGNWKKEQEKVDGKLFLRCNACQRQIKNSDCEKMGLEEIKITKSGIIAVLKHGFF